jgi:hypothetical protein
MEVRLSLYPICLLNAHAARAIEIFSFMLCYAALVDLGHKNAFDLLPNEAWNPERAAMGNSTLPTVSDKLNLMASMLSMILLNICEIILT